MKINIQPLASGDSKKLTQHINKKIKQLSKDCTSIKETDIKLRQDIVTGDKICEIYLKTTDKNIFAIQKGKTFENATDKAIAKLKGQLNPEVLTVDTESANDSTDPENSESVHDQI